MPRLKLAAAVAVGILPLAASAQTGPDIIVGDVDGVFRWGTSGGITAYSVGAILCNQGDQIANWYRNTPDHPVIAANLYRLADGRFEQVGVSWVKHTFFADVASFCGTCRIPAGYNGSQLGVGCSDAYSASLNGELFTLGPRSQVSAATGIFPYPADLSGYPSAAPTIGRRIQVANSDTDPALNPGARYFAEVQVVAADEAAFGHNANSTSWREFSVAPGTFAWTPAPGSITRRQSPALEAWREADPGVHLETIDLPGEGRLILASRASETAPGVWRYRYAVQNITSDRGVGSISLVVSPCAAISATAQRLPHYHSGEPWGNDAWEVTHDGTLLAWAAPGSGAAASALRWGTVASFEFTTDQPPRLSRSTLGLFAPGVPDSVAAAAWIPSGSSDFNGDGFLDFFDYDDFVGAFEVGAEGADFNGDGFLDFFDYDGFVTAFETGC